MARRKSVLGVNPQAALQKAINKRLTKSVSSKPGKQAATAANKTANRSDDKLRDQKIRQAEASYSQSNAGGFKRSVNAEKSGPPGLRTPSDKSGTVRGGGGALPTGGGFGNRTAPTNSKGTGGTPFSTPQGNLSGKAIPPSASQRPSGTIRTGTARIKNAKGGPRRPR